MSKFTKLIPAVCVLSLLSAPALAVPGDIGYVPDVDPNAVIEYGQSLYESGFYKQAQTEFQSILEENSNHEQANYLMGLSHMGLGEAAEAIPYFEKVLLINNFLYAAREQLGLAFLMSGNVEKAEGQLGTLTRAMNRCGDNCDVELTTAVESLKTAIENHNSEADMGSLWNQPEQQLALQESISNIHQHNYEHAIELLKNTLALTGDHPDILNYLGFTHRKLGLYDQAIAYYRRALSIDPNHLGANEYLGELYVEIGDLDRARMQLAKLDQLCAFACYQREELARWIAEATGNAEQHAMLDLR